MIFLCFNTVSLDFVLIFYKINIFDIIETKICYFELSKKINLISEYYSYKDLTITSQISDNYGVLIKDFIKLYLFYILCDIRHFLYKIVTSHAWYYF